MNKNFTVVMSVYKNDKPEYLRLAIDSLINQTIKPNEIIIITDGPITAQLERELNTYSHYENIRFIC